jgi:hypothetical protein
MPTGVAAQIREALPCNWSGANPGAAAVGMPGTYVIYLSPLDAHTRAVAEAIIARDPKFPGVTFELRPGKQPLAQAEQQVERLTNGAVCFVYDVSPDGSVTSAPKPACHTGPIEAPTLLPPAQTLPTASQPPDPCQLLTVDDVPNGPGASVDPGTPSANFDGNALADTNDPSRACTWYVGHFRMGGVFVGAYVVVKIVTAASETAAWAAHRRAKVADVPVGAGEPALAASLPAAFAQGASSQSESVRVLSYPAQYWPDGTQAELRVLTPTAIVSVRAQAVAHDEATLAKLAELVLGQLHPTTS